MKYILPFYVILPLFFYGCSTQNTSQDNFNIVLITIDTLRADHLSCYGYERETSPHIDKVAARGILFKNTIAPSSWTAPSMVSLFTSTYPINHGVIHGLAFQKARGFSQEVFSENLTTLPAALKKHGYTTFGVSSNHTLTAEFGFARGFDYFNYVNWQSADLVNEIVYAWEDEINKAERFFLWVHYVDPHYPYHPQSPWIEHYSSLNATDIAQLSRIPQGAMVSAREKDQDILSHILALYDSEVNYVDSYVGELIERFELDTNTLLIITSDHGEQFLEHGRIGHAINIHREELHVPLIIQFPDVSNKESIERQASLIDIMPTILHELNTDHPEQIIGKPLMENEGIRSSIKGMVPSRKAPVYTFAELDSTSTLKAIISPQWKYVYNYKNKYGRLYNLISDPAEQNNLVEKNSKQGKNLKDQLFHWVSQAKHYPPKSHFFQLSQEEKEKLATLGYLTIEKNDDDKDGIINGKDNCIDKPNGPMKGMCTRGYRGESCTNNEHCGANGFCSMHQEDDDRDGVGDTCDVCEGNGADDIDGDGVCDKEDNCYTLFNPNQQDSNGDGIGDACVSIGVENFWLEAEEADTIVHPFMVANDEGASGGKYIFSPNGTGNEYTPGGTIMATYTLNIPQTGVYTLWGRVQAGNGNDDSFFVQIDDNVDTMWEVERGDHWHWDTVNDRDIRDPVRFSLTSGVHTIKIKLREDGTKLDTLLLTNDVDFVPRGKGVFAE
jgi:arylsulfatase A-like enzyme